MATMQLRSLWRMALALQAGEHAIFVFDLHSSRKLWMEQHLEDFGDCFTYEALSWLLMASQNHYKGSPTTGSSKTWGCVEKNEEVQMLGRN
jgi:hypothetical protein